MAGGAAGPARVLLVLMVRNEAKIISRCLETTGPDVDAVLLADTGSDDATVELAQRSCAELGKPLRVVEHEWQDFGHNRTLSFRAAVEYARSLDWDLSATWAFVQDPDMVWRPKQPVRAWLSREPRQDCYLVQQTNVGMAYENLRLLRLSLPWTSVGVTHEYWHCPGASVARVLPEVGDFDDLGDGGCKADKFERDARLLEQALEAEPTNLRYLFYLAQTYFYLQRWDDAARCYARRAEQPVAPADEEVWYSTYRVATCRFQQDDAVEGEYWALKAAKANPDRAEPLMLLVEYFRLRAQWFKAWHYLLQAEAVPAQPSKQYLFYELEANGHRKAFERSVLSYYVSPDMGAGLDLCLAYAGPAPHEARALLNAAVYAQQTPARLWGRLDFPTPEGFVSSSVAVAADGTLNVRAVDYHIEENGAYTLRDGQFVRTRNFRAAWDAEALRWNGWDEVAAATGLPARADARILGLEDVRLSAGGAWTATTVEFSYCEANRMVWGEAYPPAGRCLVLRPPQGETPCEKNWLPVADRRVVYGWHPLAVGVVPPKGDRLILVAEHETPAWFRHLRGSAPPVELEDGLWTLTHLVVPTAPRIYLHCWVVLDKLTLRPLRVGRPFWFKHRGIEYCLGARAAEGGRSLQCFVSAWDRESWLCVLDVEELRRGLRDVS